MKAVVLCSLLWAVTAGVIWRCWRVWSRGADQLWPAKWGALSGTLLMLTFSMVMTLHPLNVAPVITFSVALVLLMAAVASAVAKPVAARRSVAATRAMRGGLGLPVERRLLRPATVGVLWGTGVILLLAVWFFTVSIHKQGPEMGRSADQGMTIAFGVVVLGVVHTGVQEARVRREQRRVRDDEQAYLAEPPSEPGLPR
ncbi:hypothetical protein ACFWJT_34825 [Streptomyces sp. NPDC127069]|uniref:hypothetical protein n=1 Tax=Streptomyces sp. NPDC127069 TaxID=3347128 RepID=UPI003646F7B8